MPASADCLLCLMRQSLEAARFATDDPEAHLSAVQKAMELVLEHGVHVNPPVIGQKIHRLIRETVDNPDPYADQKEFFNTVMMNRFEDLKKRLDTASDPLDWAVRWAISGNSIDFALGRPDEDKVVKALDESLDLPLNGSLPQFKRDLDGAQTILYLTDNAGEIVCDRLLIELLIGPRYNKKVTVAVRGKPVLNDAIRKDAEQIGLTAVVPVIDNGNDGLGTMLSQCTPSFISAFTGSDLVIAKGLANYETLIENNGPILPKKIVYLFKSKCPFISHYSGTKVGDLVIRTVNDSPSGQ